MPSRFSDVTTLKNNLRQTVPLKPNLGMKCSAKDSTAPDDDRKYFLCLPDFGFFNYFSGLLMCAAHQRISVDSDELVSRSEPTILNKQGGRHSIEKGISAQSLLLQHKSSLVYEIIHLLLESCFRTATASARSPWQSS